MDNEDLKSLIIKKIKESIPKLKSNNHSRISLFDFSKILYKPISDFFVFYNPVYKNKELEYFNEEENTDFLIFENNKVFIDYSDNLFTFHKVDEEEKILEIDLDNQEIKDKSNNNKSDDDLAEMEIDSKTDLITLSYFPLSISHCNITLCYEQDLPQVLSNELLIQFLNIFNMVKNDSLICGYDSLGGGCIINHLHFEFLFLDDFGENIKNLPIQNLDTSFLFETKLKHKNVEEISLFDGTTSIKVFVINKVLKGYKITCELGQEKTNEISSMENLYQNSISHIVNIFLNDFINKEIAHNLIISKKGTEIFLIPRKFEDNKHKYNSCWNDLAGLITIKEEKDYENINENDVKKFFEDEINLEESKFKEITDAIVEKIDSVYEITKNN
jgi:hypothetical protein